MKQTKNKQNFNFCILKILINLKWIWSILEAIYTSTPRVVNGSLWVDSLCSGFLELFDPPWGKLFLQHPPASPRSALEMA